jgi:hypothetical protein
MSIMHASDQRAALRTADDDDDDNDNDGSGDRGASHRRSFPQNISCCFCPSSFVAAGVAAAVSSDRCRTHWGDDAKCQAGSFSSRGGANTCSSSPDLAHRDVVPHQVPRGRSCPAPAERSGAHRRRWSSCIVTSSRTWSPRADPAPAERPSAHPPQSSGIRREEPLERPNLVPPPMRNAEKYIER